MTGRWRALPTALVAVLAVAAFALLFRNADRSDVAGEQSPSEPTVASRPTPSDEPSAITQHDDPVPAVRATKNLLAPPTGPSDPFGPPVDPGTTVEFVERGLIGQASDQPTSLQFGPDSRLYVGQRDGHIRVYSIERSRSGDYEVTATDTIDVIAAIQNHDDLGRPDDEVRGRLLTGLLVTGRPDAVVIYASSSDPRTGGGSDEVDTPLDTNSGIVSRITATSAGWRRDDLVRGLPRSRENHATNGLQLDERRRVLYVAQGANTNSGAPSPRFADLQEYALSGAILAIDLDAVEPGGYDLPTLNDADVDPRDPFGGHGGANQARLVPDGPVQIYSPGWRNPYDLVLTGHGRLYATDNGPNEEWGGRPIRVRGGDPPCRHAARATGATAPDALHRVTPEFYAGHPNPTRAGAGPHRAAVPKPDPEQCRYRPTGADGALATIDASTNGLAEYTASNFGGALRGDLLAAVFTDRIDRFTLDETGERVVDHAPLLTGIEGQPLDVTTQGDDEIFPGTIWVALFTVYDAPGSIMVYEPTDGA